MSLEKRKCPTCDGSGVYEYEPATEQWRESCGDQNLWERFSHAKENYGDMAYKVPPGTWSPFRKIMSFYKNERGIYTINLSRGSFPLVTVTQLKTKFVFLDRKTGEEVKFI